MSNTNISGCTKIGVSKTGVSKIEIITIIPQNGEAVGFLLFKQGYEAFAADPPLDELLF